MKDLVLLLMAVAGATIIISKSELFEPLRLWIGSKHNPLFQFAYKLITCPLCLSVWVGAIMFTLLNFTPTVYPWIAYPMAGAIATYFAYKSTR